MATPQKGELAGKMFDDELDLADAVIDGIQTRGERVNYSIRCIKFNINHSG